MCERFAADMQFNLLVSVILHLDARDQKHLARDQVKYAQVSRRFLKRATYLLLIDHRETKRTSISYTDPTFFSDHHGSSGDSCIVADAAIRFLRTADGRDHS